MKVFFLIGFGIFFAAGSALAVVGGGDVTLKAGEKGDVIFSHEKHVVDSGLTCKECHTKHFLDGKRHVKVSASAMEKGKSCGACHNGDVAFSVKNPAKCNDCHKK